MPVKIERAAEDHGDISFVTVQEFQIVLSQFGAVETWAGLSWIGMLLRPVYPIDASAIAASADAVTPVDERADWDLLIWTPPV